MTSEEKTALLERIRQIASGELQVANDDTEALAIICEEIERYVPSK